VGVTVTLELTVPVAELEIDAEAETETLLEGVVVSLELGLDEAVALIEPVVVTEAVAAMLLLTVPLTEAVIDSVELELPVAVAVAVADTDAVAAMLLLTLGLFDGVLLIVDVTLPVCDSVPLALTLVGDGDAVSEALGVALALTCSCLATPAARSEGRLASVA